MGLSVILVVACAGAFLALSLVVLATKRSRDRDERALAAARRAVREAVAGRDGPRIARLLDEARHSPMVLDALLIESESAGDPAATRAALRIGGPGGAARFARRLAGSRRAARRARGALLAGAVPIDGDLELLSELLDDRDRDVCLAAIRSLARLGTPAAAARLVDALTGRPDLRDPLADALAGPWAFGTLMAALDDPRHDVARPWLIEALGPAGGPGATEALAAVLAGGATEGRIRAARSLGRGGDRRAGPHLVAALSDPEWPVRAQAATALGAVGAHGAEPLRALAAALEDQAWWVRANAATALIEAGPDGSRWLALTLGSQDRYARERAREALDMVELGTPA